MDLPPLMPQLLRRKREEEFFPKTRCFADSSSLMAVGSLHRGDASIGAAGGACEELPWKEVPASCCHICYGCG